MLLLGEVSPTIIVDINLLGILLLFFVEKFVFLSFFFSFLVKYQASGTEYQEVVSETVY